MRDPERGSRGERTPGARAPPPTRVGRLRPVELVTAGTSPNPAFRRGAPRRRGPSVEACSFDREAARKEDVMFRSKNASRRANESTAQSRNLAARMGRWSAAHWKTATFGWLAFVVVAFMLGGAVGTKLIDDNDGWAGRVRPRRQDPRRRLQAARRRERPHPEQLAQDERSGVHGRDRGRRRGNLRAGSGSERPLAARTRKRRPDREGPARRPRRVRDPRRRRRRGRQDRPRPRARREGAARLTRSSSSASSAMQARSTRSTRSSPRTWRRPVSSRSRSRSSSS